MGDCNTRGLVFTANWHKSGLPYLAGTIMPRNWQFAMKWLPNIRSVKNKHDFFYIASHNGFYDLLISVMGIQIRILSDPDPWKS
jgi:hypothetical protein